MAEDQLATNVRGQPSALAGGAVTQNEAPAPALGPDGNLRTRGGEADRLSPAASSTRALKGRDAIGRGNAPGTTSMGMMCRRGQRPRRALRPFRAGDLILFGCPDPDPGALPRADASRPFGAQSKRRKAVRSLPLRRNASRDPGADRTTKATRPSGALASQRTCYALDVFYPWEMRRPRSSTGPQTVHPKGLEPLTVGSEGTTGSPSRRT
jgi:hypothetical protein